MKYIILKISNMGLINISNQKKLNLIVNQVQEYMDLTNIPHL
jgi:hypothetical protein